MMKSPLGRRAFLQATGTIGLVALLPGCKLPGSLPLAAQPQGGGTAASGFLNEHELATLRAAVGRFIPGPPDDPDPGAVEAGVPEAIDALLGAFTGGVPPIHAGGPFSDRAGATHNDFADFVAPDALVELGWRIRIEGSKGLPEREFAGPVTGLQDIYRSGLAHLDERAQQIAQKDFAEIPGPAQDLILADLTDGDVQTFVGAALANTIEYMYGAPEYGGNRNLAGWGYTNWPGDIQPNGSTDEEVSTAGPNTLLLDALSAVGLLKQILPASFGRQASRTAFWSGIKGKGG